MPIFDTLESVISNEYLGSLPEVAKEFGMYHSYLEYKNEIHPEYSGIYSVAGYDETKVKNPNLNIYKFFKSLHSDDDNIITGMFAVKLTNAGAFASLNVFADNARELEFYHKIYKQFGFELPSKIDHIHADYIRMAYFNMIDPKLKIEDRSAYQMAIRRSIQNQVDKSKSASYSDKNKDFPKNNCVDLETLTEYANKIIVGNIGHDIIKEFKKRMKKHPEILYWISKKSIKEDFKAPKGQGFDAVGGAVHVHMFAYDARCADKIEYERLSIAFPEATKTTISQMKQKGQVSYTALPFECLRHFSKVCQINDIEFCINDQRTEFLDSGDLCIAFLKKDLQKVDAIIKTMAEVDAKRHTYVGLQKSELDTFRDECGGCDYIRVNEKDLKKLISGKTSMDDIYRKASPEDLDNVDDIKEILSHSDR